MQDQVTIRMAGAADAPALHALEELDSRRLADGDVLVAEVEGEVRAALPMDGGDAVADPFRPTAQLVELLGVHAAQLRTSARRTAPATRGSLAVAAR
ncbi:MAG: hypothetical protein M3141_06020 [Actinomycetota bacterium]|nr:hypothetical protein [Actinomycetota bacterium]